MIRPGGQNHLPRGASLPGFPIGQIAHAAGAVAVKEDLFHQRPGDDCQARIIAQRIDKGIDDATALAGLAVNGVLHKADAKRITGVEIRRVGNAHSLHRLDISPA